MPWTETDRLLLLETPLGADKLLLRSFSGVEAISEPFHFRLDMLSEDPNIDFNAIVGQKVTFGIKMYASGQERYFNGHVKHFMQLPGEERFACYQAEIVPWLWFLTRTADCRIYQNKTVPDIIREIFGEFEFTDFDVQLQANYDPWEYCVQYRETAFSFISRLMEHEGIFYFFRHEQGKHVMVLADSTSVHKPCAGNEKVLYERNVGAGAKQHEDTVLSWQLEQDFRTGKYAMTDYNFETPTTGLLASINSQIDQGGNQKYEVFDYPGEYEKRDEGDSWAKVRMEEEEVQHTKAGGESNCRGFTAGGKFELSGFERRDQNATYVLTEVHHSGEEGGFYSGLGSGEGRYSNSFSAIPSTVRYRPLRRATKPVIQGTQTAVVVGPQGEEIYSDKYGRIKVQFHWDRRGGMNENSSCWVRVAQPWAGKGWGTVVIPRIGQEVVVSFLEGDPDRPLITGVVYNAVQMPPYTLPDRQMVNTLRSSSSPGGGNSNEIRMDDSKSQEEFYVHSAYDHNMLVDHDRRETIVNKSHHLIKNNQYEKCKERHTQVENDWRIKVGGDYSLNVGMDSQNKVGMNYALDAGTEVHIKAGMNIVLESGTTMTMKVGGNWININPGGIFIQGTMVMINSGGAPGSGCGASPAAPQDPEEVQPGGGSQSPAPPPSQPPQPRSLGSQATALSQAAGSGRPLCEH